MSGAPDEQGWKSAEAVLRAHHAARKETVVEVARKPELRVRFVFWVVLAPKQGAAELVHAGKVVTARGLSTLGAVLRDQDALGKQLIDASGLLYLVQHFASLPAEIAKAGVLTGHPLGELNPRLIFARGGATLTVHAHRLHARRGGGDRVPMLRLHRAVLKISPKYRMTWSVTAVDRKLPKGELPPATEL